MKYAQVIARFFKEHHVPHKVLLELQETSRGKGRTSAPVLGCETRWGSWLGCAIWNHENVSFTQVSGLTWILKQLIFLMFSKLFSHRLLYWMSGSSMLAHLVYRKKSIL
jgi:hypothetical protein